MEVKVLLQIHEQCEWVDQSQHRFTRRVGDYVFEVARDAPDLEWRWGVGIFDPTRSGGVRRVELGGRADSVDQAMARAMAWLEQKLAGDLEYVRKELGR